MTRPAARQPLWTIGLLAVALLVVALGPARSSRPPPPADGRTAAAEEARVSTFDVRGLRTDPDRSHFGPTQILDPDRREEAEIRLLSDWRAREAP